MAINIDIITRLRERRLTADAERIKRKVQEAGDEAGRAWDKSIVRAFRDTEKAAEGVVKAQEKVARASDGLTKSNEGITASLDRNTTAVRNWDEALKAQELATDRVTRSQAKYNAELFSAEPNLKKVRALERELGESRRALEDANWRLVRSGQEISASNRSQAEAVRANSRAQRDYEESLRGVEHAHRNVIRSHADFDGSIEKSVKRMREMEAAGGSFSQIVQDIGTTAFRTSRGIGAIAAPAIALGLFEIGRTALAATQSIALLPAAATAAAAGIGTLKLATYGFGDAINDIRDPKKFAEDLALLGPNAQQAALTIQRLLPQIDELRKATSDSFFDGINEEINRLWTQFAPSIQELTTGIATSMNQAMTGVANQLMTPETQVALQQTFDNIGVFFQNLAPAAQSLTQAFADIAASGSEWLPGFATDISNAAANFAAFIREARQSGELDVWIRQGVDAVKELSGALWEIIGIFYRAFGPDTETLISGNQESVGNLQKSWESFGTNIAEIKEIIGLVMLDGQTWSKTWKEELDSMYGPLGAIRDGIMDIPEAFAWAVNKVIDSLNFLARNSHQFLDNLIPDSVYTLPKLNEIPHIDTGWSNDWGGHQMPSAVDDSGRNAQRQREHLGLPPVVGPMGLPGDRGPGNLPVPPPPPGSGGKPSDRERLDAIRAGLDPNTYRVDPFAGVPGLPTVPLPPNAGLPGSYNPNLVNAQEALEARQKVEAEARDLEEQRKNRMALELDSQSTAEQINDAKWKELEEAQQLQKAQYDLAQKLQGSSKDMNAGMDELGAALDKDLGISKGLAGMADNLVRFLGSLAMAPMLGELNAVKNADPHKGGYGLMGILGAQGVFGDKFTGLDPSKQGPATDFGSATGYQYPAAGGGGTVQGADWEQLAQWESSGKWDINAGNGESGGLQFKPETWKAYKPAGAPEQAWMATKEQQIAAAEAVLKAQGPKAWPEAFGAHPEWFQPRASGTPPINSGTSSVGTVATGNIPKSKFSDAGLMPAAARMNDIIPALFPQITEIGGVRADPHPDHPSGRALDIMTPGGDTAGGRNPQGKALGDQIWQWMGSTGIFDMKGSLWQTMTGGNHFNHIHARIKEGMENAIPDLVNGAVSGVYGSTSSASFGGSTIPIPLPVTIVGAGMPVPGGPAATPPPGAPPPGATSPGPAPGPAPAPGGGLPAGYSVRNGSLVGPKGTSAEDFGKVAAQWFQDQGKPVPPAYQKYQAPTPPPPPTAVPHGQGFPLPTSPQIDFGGQPTPEPGTGIDPFGPGGALSMLPTGQMPAEYGPPGAGTGGPPPNTIGPFPVPAGVYGPSLGHGAQFGLNDLATGGGQPGGWGAPPSQPAPPVGPPTTQYGGLAPPSGTGSGGIGITPGGTVDTAINAAAAMVPGMGQAAATGIKLANRAIQFGGQLAGIGVQGLMETFLPTGGSELAQNSWLTRIVGGLAGAAPALPNVAGGKDKEGQNPLQPNQVQQPGLEPTPQQAPNINVQYDSHGQTEDRAGADLAYHLGQTYSPAPLTGSR